MKSLSYCILLPLILVVCANTSRATFISAIPAEAIIADPQRSLDEDACPPQTIVSVPLTLTGNTSTSANDFSPLCGLADFSPDDIYALSLDCRGWVTVSLCGSGYDCVVEAHSGSNYFDCPGFYIDCNDDYCGFQSQLSFFVEAGAFYFIIVTGYAGASGPYTMNVTQVPEPPVNDNCAGSLPINQLPYRHFGSTVCALNNYGGSCQGGNAPDVVYTLLLPCATRVRATTCGHPLMDAVIYVNSGGGCPGSTEVVCNDDACEYNQSSVEFNVSANVPYYIIVDGWSASEGYYVLHVEPAFPSNCAQTICLDLPCTSFGDTRCAANSYPQCSVGESNEDITMFTITECSQVTVSLCGSNLDWDSMLEIRTGGTCPGTDLVACVDDAFCGENFSLHGTASFIAQPGEYFAFVNGYFGSAGVYAMSISTIPCAPPPPPDSLVIRYNALTASFELYWAPVAEAGSYNIYRSVCLPLPGPPDIGDLIGTTGATDFVDGASWPPNPCGYFYQVTANSAFAVNTHQSTPGKAVPDVSVASTVGPEWLYSYPDGKATPQTE